MTTELKLASPPHFGDSQINFLNQHQMYFLYGHSQIIISSTIIFFCIVVFRNSQPSEQIGVS